MQTYCSPDGKSSNDQGLLPPNFWSNVDFLPGEGEGPYVQRELPRPSLQGYLPRPDGSFRYLIQSLGVFNPRHSTGLSLTTQEANTTPVEVAFARATTTMSSSSNPLVLVPALGAVPIPMTAPPTKARKAALRSSPGTISTASQRAHRNEPTPTRTLFLRGLPLFIF